MEINLEKQPEYEDQVEYGGFWIRFAAYLIDSIIIGIPLSILSIIIFIFFFGATGGLELLLADSSYFDYEMTDAEAYTIIGSYLGGLALTVIMSVIVYLAYFAGLHSSKWQATLGKKILGLKVTDLAGNRISFWRALGRYFAMSFISGILLIGYIVAAFTEKKQSLHDLIAGTVVVKNS